tara:strand:+ start:1868 stop:2083 length:216 start_codon:yes stop_codon:yes gene_type:complete
MNDQHVIAAHEVWNALPWAKRRDVLRSDFVMAFTLGRVSMKACYDKAELLQPCDEPKPFNPNNKTTTKTQQ